MKNPKNCRGITLIELMVIVTIIGIVSTMAFPQFTTTINRLKFKGAARDVVSTMRLARSNAITHKQPVGVHFDGDLLTMTMFVDIVNPTNGAFESGDSVLTVDSLSDSFAAISTSFGATSVVYRPNGTATATGTVNMVNYVDNDGINIGTIEVLASTGRTKVGGLHFY
ncbi:MAG: GspH/FimT family pseudopilin [candidate division Zixibacteria bacterium]|nr:GspH/FimT family pseudopilin [candidate division Zixibacteria bacterium]